MSSRPGFCARAAPPPSGNSKWSMAELHRTIYSKVSSVLDGSPNLANAEEQVKKILSKKELPFDQWYGQQIVPTLRAAQKASAKSMVEATRHKQFADMYKEMSEPCFTTKAFHELNKAIIFAPPEKTELVFDCLAQRSNLHYHCDQFQSALSDIEQALAIRKTSITCIERKIVLLKQLNQAEEAYHFVCQLMTSNLFNFKTDRKRYEQLKNWRKELKQYSKTGKQSGKLQEKSQQSSFSHFLQIDFRLNITRNQLNQRVCLKATEDIPEETTVLDEEPICAVITAELLHSFCAQCYSKCEDTFWPCPGCTEVVFCSAACVQQGDHQAECGMIGLMNQHLEQQSRQVYQLLAKQGHKEMLKMEQNYRTTAYPYKKLNNELTNRQPNLDRTLMLKWFGGTQADARHWLAQRCPTRTATELTSAIFLLAIYFFKRGEVRISDVSAKKEAIGELICLLALEQAKVCITEYGWNQTNDQGDESRGGNFQCLIGSRVGHHCEHNAEWTFDQKLRRFSIKTIKKVSQGEQISISFGSLKESSFFRRLKHLKGFQVMCACARCMDDSRDNFALRCTHCNGPVPCDEKQSFPNDRCLTCELPNQEYTRSKVKKILQEFRTVRSMTWLLGEAVSAEQLDWLENKMSTLSVLVDLHNRQFLLMIAALCEEYIRRHMFKRAIDWYQWLVEGMAIFICADDDPFVRFHNLDQWAGAYTNFLDRKLNQSVAQGSKQKKKKKNKSPDKASVAYVEVADGIFKRMFSVLELLNMKQYCTDSSLLSAFAYEQMMQSLYKSTWDKLARFQEVCAKLKQATSGVAKQNVKANRMDSNDCDSKSSGDERNDDQDDFTDKDEDDDPYESEVLLYRPIAEMSGTSYSNGDKKTGPSKAGP